MTYYLTREPYQESLVMGKGKFTNNVNASLKFDSKEDAIDYILEKTGYKVLDQEQVDKMDSLIGPNDHGVSVVQYDGQH